jgi:hypothetical protein
VRDIKDEGNRIKVPVHVGHLNKTIVYFAEGIKTILQETEMNRSNV